MPPAEVIDINACATAPIAADIGEAWVMDPRAATADPAKLEELPGADPRARPCLVAMPGPLAGLERRVAAYRAAGGPAVLRICPGPKGHGYPLEPWALSPIPEFCAREELALAIDFQPGPNDLPWSGIVGFARAYPWLAVIVLAAPLGGPTAARALDAAANLVLDTAGATKADEAAIPGLVRACGAYRLAYASGDARVPAPQVSAGLDPADAAAVLSGTASHLAAGTWSATYL
jgi:hypothetical protein